MPNETVNGNMNDQNLNQSEPEPKIIDKLKAQTDEEF